jgi:molybdopterin-containing oxidoreductase family membrane subunit
VVSFDFAMALTPGWHATIFPPYFVAGAIFSGFAMVWTIVIPMRRWFGLKHYVTLNHLDATAKVVLFVSLLVGSAYLIEFFIAWYSGVPAEIEYFYNRVFGQWWWSAWILLCCNMVLPLSLFSQKLRRNTTWLFILSLFINLGMWYERWVIVVPSLSHEFEPWQWTHYVPSWIDMGFLVGSFGWFFMWFLLFTKQLPVFALAEIKEIIPPKLSAGYGHDGPGQDGQRGDFGPGLDGSRGPVVAGGTH